MDEIEKVVKEEMTPQLDKLRKEKAMYISYTTNQTELDRLNRSVRFCLLVLVQFGLNLACLPQIRRGVAVQ